MMFESKGTLIASVIINVISIICLICVSVHFTKISSAQEKLINDQNKTIIGEDETITTQAKKIDDLQNKILG